MNIWRVKSRTGKTVHLTSDRIKTFCGRTIKDDWKFLYPLKDRVEALESVENLCSICNKVNLEEWEKEEETDDIETTGGNDTEKEKSVRSDKPKGLGTW